MAEHNEIGKYGENIAFDYLLKNGYKIKERNWRFGKGEIDVIAEENNTIVIVEVKTRSSEYFGDPEESVSRKKQKKIVTQ